MCATTIHPANDSDPWPALNLASSNRSPSRAAATSNTTPGRGALNRTPSARTNGAPLSARSAARKPNDATSTDQLRAELQPRIDDLTTRLQASEQAHDSSQKATLTLQQRLDEALKEQTLLEETVHEQREKMEELENSRKESLRAKRELESIYETERVSSLREREAAGEREEEMQASMRRMKETIATREMRASLGDSGAGEDTRRHSLTRNPSFRSANASPSPDAHAAAAFAPPGGLARSDSRSSSKLVMQKDKLIESLRMELAEAQIKIAETEAAQGGGHAEVLTQVYELKMQNARLMEENESFQLLLAEKTLAGDFSTPAFHLRGSDSAHAESRPSSRAQPNSLGRAGGKSLADELGSQAEDSQDGESERTRILEREVQQARDQNKALTLYINNIISRVLQHDLFEQILDKTPDLMAPPTSSTAAEKALPPMPPPPVPPKDESGGTEEATGFLQRARSVIGGPRRPRPLSQVPSSNEQTPTATPVLTATENLTTAPRIPLSRANSRSSAASGLGHRRAQSDFPAAGIVVGSMYRGPSPSTGPTSPGLSSSGGGRNSFFGPVRLPSASGVPTIAESQPLDGQKENAQPTTARDSKLSNNRNSLLEPSSHDIDSGVSDLSNPSSPPRSTTSSGDRDTRPSGGAVMMGSKMRPLRLVQQTDQLDEQARKAGNRGSWFGWMNKGGAPPPAGRSVSGPEAPS